MPTVECDWCGKYLKRTYSHLAKNDHNFCNSECYGKWQTEQGTTAVSCEQCGKTFRRKNSLLHQSELHFCSRECSQQYTSEHNGVELTCSFCGRTYKVKKSKEESSNYCSVECRAADNRAPEQAKFCPVCMKAFWVKPFASDALTCSDECAYKYKSETYRGERHWLWKGGPAYRGANWEEQAQKARERDNHTCQICGRVQDHNERGFDVHHVVPLRSFDGNWKQANELTNLITLCRPCHTSVERGVIESPIP